jgi:cardiolipin synthase A/B
LKRSAGSVGPLHRLRGALGASGVARPHQVEAGAGEALGGGGAQAEVAARTDRFRRAFESALGVPFVGGSRIEPLRNGIRIFPSMLAAIESARHAIEFETYVYWKGLVAERFARALADAAARGVRVRVLLDAVGCAPMPREIRRILEESSVEVREFGPVRVMRLWRLDHRTHRKILVCDGRVGFTGGVGIAEEWEGDARSPDEWRETHFRMEGPVVRGLRAAFFQHWLATEGGGDEVLDEITERYGERPAGWAATSEQEGARLDEREGPADMEMQVVRSDATGRWTDVQTLFRSLLAVVEERLRITTAYFVPDEGLVRALVAAARRGVEVEIMNPGPHTDHRVCQLAGEDTYEELLSAGVRIWRYQPTMLHAKIATLDGVLSCVGSANLNQRSLNKDDEIAVLVLDPGFTSQLDRDFDDDRDLSRPITDGRWARRSWLRIQAQRFTRLFRHQL